MFRVILRRFRYAFANTFRDWIVQYHNPDSNLLSPISWRFDDVKQIHLSKGTQIGPFSQVVVLANSPHGTLPGKFVMDEYATIGSHANIFAVGGEISIARHALIAPKVTLVGVNHRLEKGHFYWNSPWDETKTGVVIAENVWIGANVTVLPGCKIGANSIIGAGSVVTKEIPANEIWAGIPARKISSLTE